MFSKTKPIAFLLMSFCLSLGATVTAQAKDIPPGTLISTCGDGGGWPPYHFFEQKNGKATTNIVGYDVDVVNEILTQNGLKFSVEMPPWKRCLSEADKGQKYQIALSSSFNEERNKTYLYSDHYYNVTPYYFYIKNQYPKGLKITDPADFKKYNICGLLGYNYKGFNLPTESIDMGAKSFDIVAEKTRRMRCDIFIARFEIFAGFALSGKDYIKDYNLDYAPIPGAPSDKFYLLISRNYEYANELKSILDAGFASMRAEGRLDALLEKYIGPK